MKWKPGVFESKEFDCNNMNGTTIAPNGKETSVSKDVVINDFKIVLKDFYSYIGPPLALKLSKGYGCL